MKVKIKLKDTFNRTTKQIRYYIIRQDLYLGETKWDTMKNQLNIVLILACITTLLDITACKSIGGDIAETRLGVRYQCDNSSSFMVSFGQDNTSATINFDGRSQIELPSKRVASGFLYEDMSFSLRGKGNEVIWKIGREPAVKCYLTN